MWQFYSGKFNKLVNFIKTYPKIFNIDIEGQTEKKKKYIKTY